MSERRGRLASTFPRDASVAVLFALSAIAIVSPILTTTFLGDDVFNSYVDGWMANHHLSLAGAIVQNVRDRDLAFGRFIPLLQVVNVLQFHLVHAPLPLKILQALAIGVDVATLYLLVRAAGGSASRAGFAASVALVTLQIRYFLDPIAMFNLHFPLATEAALLCLMFCARYARSKDRRNVVVAVVCYVMAVSLYETFIPLVVAIPFLLSDENRRRNVLSASAPLFFVAAAELSILAFVRHLAPQRQGTLYAPRLTAEYFHTFARQLMGTVPFSYVIDDPQSVFRRASVGWLLHPSPFAIAAALAAATAVWTSRGAGDVSSRRGLLVAGLALLLCPPLFIALSPYYQEIVRVGTPHTPVFIQGFGLALCACTVGRPRGVARVFARGRLLFAAALGIGVYTVACANALVVTHFDAFLYPRETIVRGLQAGAASDLRDGDALFLDRSYIVNANVGDSWENAGFYRLWSGRMLITFQAKLEPTVVPNVARAFDLRSRHNTARSGALLVTRITSTPDRSLHVSAARIFERYGAGVSGGARPSFVLAGFAARDFSRIDSTAGFAIYAFHPRCGLLSPDVVSNDEPTRGTLHFGDGFFEEESDAKMRWRWGARQASLAIDNPSATTLSTELLATVGSIGTSSGSVAIDVPGRTIETRMVGIGAPLRLPIIVPARGEFRVRFAARAENVAAPGDGRDVRFRLIDARLRDTSGCALEDE